MLHFRPLLIVGALLLVGAAVQAAKSPAPLEPPAAPTAPSAAQAVDALQDSTAEQAAAEQAATDLASPAVAEPGQATIPIEAAEPAPAEGQAHEPGAESTLRIPAAGLHRLEYRFKTGEAVRWEVVHRAVVDSTIGGTNQTAETRSTSVKLWQIKNVTPAGEINLVHSVESIDMWQKMQGRQEVHFDSRQAGKPPAGYEDVAKAVGIPLTLITIDRHGKVLKREEQHPQPNAGSSLFTIPLPEQPVAVGYSWSAPLDVEVVLQGGSSKKIAMRQHFTLEKVSNGVASIQIESQVLTPLHDPAIEAQLVQRMINGTLKFDIERGRVISQQVDLDKRVIGFSGPSSSMHYLTRLTEELLPPSAAPAVTTATAATAAKPAAKSPPKLQQPESVTRKPAPQAPAALSNSARPAPKKQLRR